MLAAQGDAMMVIDADLQDPPELIPEFVAKWQQGYDVVYGIREKRTGESPLRILPTMLAMRFTVSLHVQERWRLELIHLQRPCHDVRG